jgi:hypothetical protein
MPRRQSGILRIETVARILLAGCIAIFLDAFDLNAATDGR